MCYFFEYCVLQFPVLSTTKNGFHKKNNNFSWFYSSKHSVCWQAGQTTLDHWGLGCPQPLKQGKFKHKCTEPAEMRIPGPCTQRSWLSRSGVGPRILHFKISITGNSDASSHPTTCWETTEGLWLCFMSTEISWTPSSCWSPPSQNFPGMYILGNSLYLSLLKNISFSSWVIKLKQRTSI